MRRPLLLAAVLAFAPLLPLAATATAGDAERAAVLARALETRRLKNVRFEATKLEDVLKFLRVATGFNFVVKRDVLAKAGVDVEQVKANLVLDDVSVATVLSLVLEPHGLVTKVERNVVFVTTKADALGKPVTVLHPISHITWQ